MSNHYVFTLILLASTLLALSGCSKTPTTALNAVINNGELVILTRLDPTTYQLKAGEQSGFEFELASLFAEKLGVRARFILPNNFHDILKLTGEHEADFAAAGLSITPQRQHLLRFTPPYYEVTQQLIYHYRSRRPRSTKYLKDSFFEVLAGSSHAENLRKLKTSQSYLSWVEASNTNVFELIEMVNNGLLDYTIADSNQFQTYRGQFPQLSSAFNISKPEQIAWAFPLSNDSTLYDEAVSFLNEIKLSGVLKQLQDKHFGYTKNLNYINICTFRRHVKSRLPKLHNYFLAASEKYNIDWKLLAAVAYQESHWNPKAISPTGVRGIMMLTKATAKQMKILNRLDPEQSIDGGAKYLATRLKKIPERINEPDKTWMALASYNIGFGHLEDARILTQQQGGDPDRWIDVKQYLPLLTQKKWYKQTKHGYARGKEPVTYIENVRQYYDLLNKSDELNNAPKLPARKHKAQHIQLPAL